jgi:S-adenosylmethionine-diacylglycerol 3-amino-3-carboxypropyl transferase
MEKIKFAVVREDPIVEETIIREFSHKQVLMVASGGCSALSLQSMFPNIQCTLFDTNPSQIQLVKTKLNTLKDFDPSLYPVFNIGIDSKDGLNSCGEFESLFRSFRAFIYEFILNKSSIEQIFVGEKKQAENIILNLISNKYWPVAFDLYFSDSMLITMFGNNAIQHATPHSYPSYFRYSLEKGLKHSEFQNNHFLQHIFLGYYINNKSSLPHYLSYPNINNQFHYITDSILNIEVINYDFICLSNIFDWMDEESIENHLSYIGSNAQKGATVLFRQLNNKKNYHAEKYGFSSNPQLEKALIKQDKSLFYNKINILTKR